MLKKILFLLLMFCSVFGYSQERKVGGQVTSFSDNEPLVGATIRVKGTDKGTVTDFDGNFSINVAINQTLEFSYVGMLSEEVLYNGQSTVNVKMKEDKNLLDDVVVIGYQTMKKSDLTGAVSVFDTKQMKNRSVTGTVGDALGSIPGVNVRTEGAPGREGKVEIRGTGTFGNSTPLYVVDGVISGANRDFNFNDIESIQVLKDASAAAIYGSRAGNGVIIITTKQGKEGKMKIDVSSRLTLQWLPRYDYANRDRWIELNDMAFQNAINDGSSDVRNLANHADGNTNWQDEMFKTGIVQDHNISFSGGNKESRYFISGNYQGNSGTTIGTKSDRFTLRSNTSAERSFGEYVTFRVGENITLSHYSVDELDSNPIYDVARMLPTISVYNPQNASLGGYGYGDTDHDITLGTNPIAKEDLTNTTNSNLRVRGNAFTELDAFKMFKYRFNFGFDFSSDKHKYLRKLGSWSLNQPVDPSSLNKNQGQSHSLVFDNTLEFNKSLGKHNLNALLGLSYQTSKYEQVWGTKNDIINIGDSYYEQLNVATGSPLAGSYENVEKLFSVFGRFNYNYDEKYLFSFTLRRDESSKFPKKNRVGYFPSVSAGWRISREAFFNASWVDDLKIRANYGVLGTSNIEPYQYTNSMNIYPQVVFGDNKTPINGIIQTSLINEDLKWEKVLQFNAGFDAVLLNNRFMVSADYFIKESRDVLTRTPILLATGNSGANPYVNAATLRNTGFEIGLSWKDNIGKDMDYSISLNGSYLKNHIAKLGYGVNEFNQWDTKSRIGQSIGQWYLIKTDGFFNRDAEILSYKNSKGKVIQPNAVPGDIRYVDANDDGQITDDDRQYCGESIPKYQLDFNFGFRYKDFDLQLQMAGAFGFKIFNGMKSLIDRFDDNSNYRADYDPWTPDNWNAKDPRPVYKNSRNATGGQDRWLENGNYLKVKQIAIGYNVPKSFLGNMFDNIRVFVNAQNLLTFTSYTGLDPEFLNTNIYDRSYDGGAFPNPRGITFGAQITF